LKLRSEEGVANYKSIIDALEKDCIAFDLEKWFTNLKDRNNL
jgi:hypothetical protein